MTSTQFSSLSVVAADPSPARLGIISAALSDVRHISPVSRLDAELVLEEIRSEPRDLLILGADEPDEDLVSVFESVMQGAAIPVIVFVDKAPPNAATSFVRGGAAAFVVEGLSGQRIAPIVEAAFERYRIVSALHSELVKSKNELSARKVIERAKGLLMQQQRLTEAEAYDSMRRLAMARGKTVLDVSQTIITLSELMPNRPAE